MKGHFIFFKFTSKTYFFDFFRYDSTSHPELSISSEDKSANDAAPTVNLYGEYSVNSGLDFGRSAIEASTKPSTPINTLKSITKQLMPASVTDMIITDVRTPPKIKSQIVHSQMQSLLAPGKGEAIPVVLEGNDEMALEKISSDNFKYTHSDATPSTGLSTWILLNSDAVSTPISHHKKVNKPVLFDISNLTAAENITDSKKKAKPVSSTTTEKNIKNKIEPLIMKKPDRKPVATIQKVNQTHAKKPISSTVRVETVEEVQTSTASSSVVTLQDSKFKTKTPVIVGKVPNTTKAEVNTSPLPFIETIPDNNTRLGTPVVTYPHVPVRPKPSPSSSSRKPFSTTVRPPLQLLSSSISTRTPLSELVTISTLAATQENTLAAITDNSILDKINEQTTKKTITLSSKKKKKKNKNKNKRRRTSSKKPAKVQSKISEDDNSTSKLPGPLPNRPLSTRIYNYLAREVMPNVGVGIVGLMLTAGLAGLLLYPFGAAVPIRRNYEKPHPSYNLNDYPPVGEVDNAQPEESVLSQVLAGMSNSMNQYSREQPDMLYKTPPKYKPARFDNPGSYVHHKDVKFTTERPGMGDPVVKYSELGDVVSGPHESVKFTSFDINDSIKYPGDGSQPSSSYSTIDLTTSNSQNEPVPYHKHNPSTDTSADSIKHNSMYSTLGEYASYNNLNEPVQNPVYNGEYDYKNHKNDENNIQEFKVSSEMEVVTHIPENQTTTTTKSPKHDQQPAFAALEGIPKNYRTLQTSIRFEDPAAPVLPMNQDFMPSEGVYAASIEHGPRSLQIRRRRKRNTASSENEVDSVLIPSTEKLPEIKVTTTPAVQFISTEATTIADFLMKSSEKPNEANGTVAYHTGKAVSNMSDMLSNEILPTDEIRITNTNFERNITNFVEIFPPKPADFEVNSPAAESTAKPKDETTTKSSQNCENCDLSNVEEVPPSTPPAVSFSSMFRRLLDFKLRVGLELIRATSEAISNYLSSVQQRMTDALRSLQRSTFRTADSKSKKVVRRDKRFIFAGSM